MKPLLIYLSALLVAAAAFAQDAEVPSTSKLDEYMEAGMEVAGVRAPYYDENGELQARLYGGHAKVLEGGVAEVANLRIDVFQDQKVFATVFAPACFTKIVDVDGRNTLVVYSEGDVLLDMEEMTISGRGFRFSSENNQFEILHDSTVLVKASARDARKVAP